MFSMLSTILRNLRVVAPTNAKQAPLALRGSGGKYSYTPIHGGTTVFLTVNIKSDNVAKVYKMGFTVEGAASVAYHMSVGEYPFRLQHPKIQVVNNKAVTSNDVFFVGSHGDTVFIICKAGTTGDLTVSISDLHFTACTGPGEITYTNEFLL